MLQPAINLSVIDARPAFNSCRHDITPWPPCSPERQTIVLELTRGKSRSRIGLTFMNHDNTTVTPGAGQMPCSICRPPVSFNAAYQTEFIFTKTLRSADTWCSVI